MVFYIAGRHQFRSLFAHESSRLRLEHLCYGLFGQLIAVAGSLRHDIEQHNRNARIRHLRGNARPHDTRANNGDFPDLRHCTASRTVAMPWPPPMHCVASAYLPPVRLSSDAALPTMRAPVAPSGWPSAIAPPSRLILAGSRPRSRMQASDCEAKASLSSITSSAPASSPARSSALRVAGTGPMPMMSGAQPATATDLIRARISSPWLRA